MKESKNTFACLIAGSRTFNDYELLKTKMDILLSNKDNVLIISGGAKGADALAERYAKEKHYNILVMPAEWEKFGKSAGYIRNKAWYPMVSLLIFTASLIIHYLKKEILADSFIYNTTIDFIGIAISITNLLIVDEIETRREVIKEVYETPSDYKKTIAFIGAHKTGTTFIINAIAAILTSKGVKTAILDLTQNKDTYSIYAANNSEYKEVAASSIPNLAIGQDVPFEVWGFKHIYHSVFGI
jgi:hypothetical protein